VRLRRGLAVLTLVGCGTSPRLVVQLVLPDSPSPAADGLTSLAVAVVWNGGDAGVIGQLRDGGLDIPLPAGPVDVTVTGLDDAGTALWRGMARNVDVPANAGAGPAVATMFFGRIGSFSSFDSVVAMPPLAGSAAASWADGRVVISGGGANGVLSDDLWVYDPRTVQVSQLAQSLLQARAHHLALPLLSLSGVPMVLLAGGDAEGGGSTDTVELVWSDGGAALAPLSTAQGEPSGAVAGDGLQVLIGCGSADSNELDLYLPAAVGAGNDAGDDGGWEGLLSLPTDCELGQITWVPALGAYVVGDGADGSLSLVDLAGAGVTPWASTPSVRTSFGAVADGSGVLQFGGLIGEFPVATYETDTDAGPQGAASLLTTARSNFGWLQLPNGEVLVVGGSDLSGAALATAELFDPRNPALGTTTISMAQPRIHPAVADISGYGAALVVSGELEDGGPVGGLEIYTY
jgi:hypothetical protein